MKYVKYMPYHTMKNASRNRREIMTAIEQGYDVSIFSHDTVREGLLLPDSIPLIFDGITPLSYQMSRMKRIFTMIKNRITVFNKTRCLDADAFSCHDLESLRSAYIATRFIKNKPLLIYDSHEFEIGRNSNRSKFQTWKTILLERYLIKKCAFTIVENGLIADEIAKVHHLSQKPIGIRSTPQKWTVDTIVNAEVRKKINKEFKEPVQTIIMYHGIIGSGRGIEILVDVLERMPQVGLMILGPEDNSFCKNLRIKIEKKRLDNRVVFHDAVPQPDLWKFIGAVDISMALIEPVSRSYELTLPNKILESIQSLTPIIMSDLPGMREINDEYEIGLACNPQSVEDVCNCISRMIEDKELYSLFKRNLARAKNELCWEKEKGRLIEAWNKYILN